MTELSIHELSLGFSHDKQMLVEFLAKHHLNYEDDIEAAFGVFDSDENLTGCGCCAGNLLKCFAVDESLRGQNALEQSAFHILRILSSGRDRIGPDAGE